MSSAGEVGWRNTWACGRVPWDGYAVLHLLERLPKTPTANLDTVRDNKLQHAYVCFLGCLHRSAVDLYIQKGFVSCENSDFSICVPQFAVVQEVLKRLALNKCFNQLLIHGYSVNSVVKNRFLTFHVEKVTWGQKSVFCLRGIQSDKTVQSWLQHGRHAATGASNKTN